MNYSCINLKHLSWVSSCAATTILLGNLVLAAETSSQNYIIKNIDVTTGSQGEMASEQYSSEVILSSPEPVGTTKSSNFSASAGPASIVDESPLADAGSDIALYCDTVRNTAVQIQGNGSTDPEGHELTYKWKGPFPEGGGETTISNPIVNLPLGNSELSLVVGDGNSTSLPDTMNVLVMASVTGFEPPLSSLVADNTQLPLPSKAFKRGRTIPLKLKMTCGGQPIITLQAAAPRITGIKREGDALNLEEIDLDSGQANDTGVDFRYSEESGFWVYNLSTRGLATGTYRIILSMPDNRIMSGGFVLK